MPLFDSTEKKVFPYSFVILKCRLDFLLPRLVIVRALFTCGYFILLGREVSNGLFYIKTKNGADMFRDLTNIFSICPFDSLTF